ncbi:HNH endonuclease [Arthrobacter tecti]
MARVEGDWTTGCWNWTGRTQRGYGKWTNRGTTHRAHRWGWVHIAGLPLPNDDLDHICENPACVRPGHLQPVTRSMNLKLRHWRKKYATPHGLILTAPVQHRTMAEAIKALQYGLPNVFQEPEILREAPLIQATHDGRIVNAPKPSQLPFQFTGERTLCPHWITGTHRSR